jgi:hypothetical protein
LHTQQKPKNIITTSYLLYCIVIYFTVLHIIFTFTYIHTLCLTTTRWSWGHMNEELFCRLLEEERQEIFWLFPKSSILNPSFPRGENLLLLQHSTLGVPTWHTCLVSSMACGDFPCYWSTRGIVASSLCLDMMPIWMRTNHFIVCLHAFNLLYEAIYVPPSFLERCQVKPWSNIFYFTLHALLFLVIFKSEITKILCFHLLTCFYKFYISYILCVSQTPQ